MCECKNVKIGSYANQVVLRVPEYLILTNSAGIRIKEVSVDKCLSTIIEDLWSLGIKTTGCCCGHNTDLGYIGVLPDCIANMKELGFMVRFNPSRPDAEDSFYPSTAYAMRLKENRTMEVLSTYKVYIKELDRELDLFFHSPSLQSYKTVSDLFLRCDLMNSTCSSVFENCFEAKYIKKRAPSYNADVADSKKRGYQQRLYSIAFKKILFKALFILALTAGLALVVMMLWDIFSTIKTI